jgi:NTP pyrophosphatase (non-canonical NTP hydrolase)
MQHCAEELADVLLYLVCIAQQCKVDIADAASKKIVKNSLKYRPDKNLRLDSL